MPDSFSLYAELCCWYDNFPRYAWQFFLYLSSFKRMAAIKDWASCFLRIQIVTSHLYCWVSYILIDWPIEQRATYSINHQDSMVWFTENFRSSFFPNWWIILCSSLFRATALFLSFCLVFSSQRWIILSRELQPTTRKTSYRENRQIFRRFWRHRFGRTQEKKTRPKKRPQCLNSRTPK